MKPGKTGLERIINAAGYSLAGIRYAVKNEAAFRQELILCLILIPLAFWLSNSAVHIVLLSGSCLLVLIVELINSAIEAVVDRSGHEYHELAGRAKDLGSAAVFGSLIVALITWLLILHELFVK